MTVDKRTFTIGVLSICAVILFVANILAPRGVIAADSISNRDNEYQLQTGRVTNGGEALYITDSRSGMMAGFIYDVNRRTLIASQPRGVQDAFGGRGGPMRR